MRFVWISALKDLRRLRREPVALLTWLAIPTFVVVILTLVFGPGGSGPHGKLLIADQDHALGATMLTKAFSQGALGKMLTPFKLGVGGPVAGGRQYMSWIHVDDLVGIMLAAIGDERWSGPVNATAPEPQRNRDFSKALGRALRRPSLLPVPGAALRLLYGEMAEIVTTGARVLPAKALVLGYEFRYPKLDSALRAALGGE